MGFPAKWDVVAVDAKGEDDIDGWAFKTILLAQNISYRQAENMATKYRTVYYHVSTHAHPYGVQFVNVGKKPKIIPQ